MITTAMRSYSYYSYNEPNAYGQQTLSPTIQGQVKIALYISTQSIQGNINYKDCSYVGLTLDKDINESWVIQKENEKLKVLYINQQGRFKQVFLQKI